LLEAIHEQRDRGLGDAFTSGKFRDAPR
jgi:hypothetical protein